jgi:preprotein translocase subunit Sec63
VLDLPPSASLEEVRQSYRDMVVIWHPDRFCSNPRLKKRAEIKLKEINMAYGVIQEYLSRGNPAPPESKEAKRDPVEVLAETGTRMILKGSFRLYSAVRVLLWGNGNKGN